MKHRRHAIATILFAFCVYCSPSAHAAESSGPRPQLTEALSLLDQANLLAASDENAARPIYRQAAAQIDQVRTKNDLRNARLEHALGNAYLNAGERGHAVLAYRRALLLDPTDRSISETLASTRSAVGSQITPSRTNRIIRWLLSWRGSIPRSTA